MGPPPWQSWTRTFPHVWGFSAPSFPLHPLPTGTFHREELRPFPPENPQTWRRHWATPPLPLLRSHQPLPSPPWGSLGHHGCPCPSVGQAAVPPSPGPARSSSASCPQRPTVASWARRPAGCHPPCTPPSTIPPAPGVALPAGIRLCPRDLGDLRSRDGREAPRVWGAGLEMCR